MESKSITLGCYPQNSESSNKEPMEWLILKREEKRILCISKFLLDCKPYHTTLEDVTWENCTLRKWLNHDFLKAAFTKEEQSQILVTEIETPLHNTKDCIFLLSSLEAEEYFDFDERATNTTEYAREQGAWFLADHEHKYAGNGSWWLRYPEWLEDDESVLYSVLSCVNFDGYIESAADQITATTCCVRPALWLKVM